MIVWIGMFAFIVGIKLMMGNLHTEKQKKTYLIIVGFVLACGTPIVVYNTTACPEFVTGNTGVIMHSSEDMIPALQEILKRNEHIGREQISLECQNYVAENFNLKTNIQKYLDLFDSITK